MKNITDLGIYKIISWENNKTIHEYYSINDKLLIKLKYSI